ncbi:EAL domain-containing protein [uncultured Maricaulis sp.]|uniref:putative bifunctional diguanylate cyclase/phosphodiesterase n=1 Tax=uncultured Maricaulis sp. TaxID=174710 RepID=UPI0030DA009F|tara:strand:- start:45950 stop:48121 length:2172 start_codon:yes stop_codon:yes gene_type:complete
MNKALDKKLGLYINVAALVSLIASVLTIYFFVGSLNANARRTDSLLLAQGIDAAAEQNENWAVDYGWWDAAVDYFEAGETDALEASMAEPLQDHSGFDFVILSNEAEGRIYGWHRASGLTIRDDILSPDEMGVIRQELAGEYGQGKYLGSHFVSMDDRSYIASITVLGEYEDRSATDPLHDTLLIIGTEMDDAFFMTLEEHYLVHNIQFFPPTVAPINGAVPVRDRSGHQVGQLIWRSSLPGIETLRVALIPLIAYILAFLAASQVIGRHARRLARNAEENERRARLAASTDSLSGLPNRHGFTHFIDSEAAKSAASGGQAAVIYIDLNGFKAVNDKAGHQAGDAVIVEVAQRFRAVLPPRAYIARMGGDEFAAILIDPDDARDVLDIARTLLDSLQTPIDCDGRLFDIGAAIGVSESSADATKTFLALVDEADLAMYRAKADQLDYPLYYDADFAAVDENRRALDADMEAGLGRQEFYVAYQPIVLASTGETASLEALLRWEHPTRGNIPPDVFIPAAEHSKMIHALGDLVLDSVCREFDRDSGISVSINLSPTQLNDPDLCRRFVAKLAQYELTPAQIELELTETVLIEDFGRAKARMDELSEAGFRLNLDDFGTGFASISYLHTLPFSKIKVDKSFIDTIGKSESANKMLQAMSLLSEAMRLEIVAEGVETEAQASLLRLLGFDYLQGWHFGRPITAATRAQLRLRKDVADASSPRADRG